MRRVAHDSSAIATSSVRLEGGPNGLTGTVELTELDEVIFSDEKIKIRYGNGYEHYETVRPTQSGTDGGEGSEYTTFRWVARTKIAE
ncbi:DUF5988 family protein [Streptomyces parvus]|uniref:DUF5988 family protein n=1 Tax=Streptomyces TaxID=1883 RepID=UPI000516D705|nr:MULTISPECIES: DUF5988 family protein [unclassified Streptomyces]MYX03002.1 hypothetical protein [Streptomyces sp. SID8378]SNB89328.1 hypothetical protein SAMN02745831_05618 [Streptomyces sp. PgraA7]